LSLRASSTRRFAPGESSARAQSPKPSCRRAGSTGRGGNGARRRLRTGEQEHEPERLELPKLPEPLPKLSELSEQLPDDKQRERVRVRGAVTAGATTHAETRARAGLSVRVSSFFAAGFFGCPSLLTQDDTVGGGISGQ